MVDVGFSHVLDEENITQAQEKCLDLDIQATNIMYRSLNDCIFGEIINMKIAHEIWTHLNKKYGVVSDDDDDDEPKEEAHECVKHDHNLVIVEDCSTSWLSDDDDNDDRSTTSSLEKMDGDTPSDANDDSTSSTLGDDGSCRAVIVMLLQAHPLHHIASCHKVIPRYLMQMWLIMLIHVMSLLVDLLA